MPVVQALLAAGADSSIRCGDAGVSALDVSARARHVEFARVLLEHGTDANAARADGTSSLHLAADDDTPEIVSLLCLNGANVDALSGHGYALLQLAAINGKAAAARALLVVGADANNGHGEDGLSALDRAARFGYVDLITALIEHGADVNDDNGRETALHIAAWFDETAAVEVLLGAGADIGARVGGTLNTPLIVATDRNSVSDCRPVETWFMRQQAKRCTTNSIALRGGERRKTRNRAGGGPSAETWRGREGLR